MANPKNWSPHLQRNPKCLLCHDGAMELNHCSWCGGMFYSHTEFQDHLRKTECGPELVKWLQAV